MASTPTRPTRKAVTKAGSGTAVAWMAAAAVITIIVTRAYLMLTGYPQVGGEIFHIAHAVWGGLLMMIALAVSLSIANRWATAFTAIAGGIGIGLFVDEIGKFITKDNDYFFPLAAPLCYALLAALGVVAMRVGSKRPPHARDHLYAALELMKPAADGPLTYRQVDVIEKHLKAVHDDNPLPQEESLATALDEALSSARTLAVPDNTRWEGRLVERFKAFEDRFFPRERQVKLSRFALGLLGIVGLIAGPGVAGYAVWQIFGPGSLSGNNSLLGQNPGPVAWTCAALAGIIGLVAAFFAWRAVRQLGGNDADVPLGTRWGISSLMLMLGGVNVLSSYFNQFLVFIDACLQVGVVGMLVRVRSRAKDVLDGHDSQQE